MKLLPFLLLCTLGSGSVSVAQDTVSVMYYNMLKFPSINSARITYLQTVAQHVLPDILVVCELTGSSGVTTILNEALNVGVISHYASATFTDGPDTENMLFYNTTKLGLVSQNIISTSLRDIDEYVLYYKNPNLTAASDTAYLYVYGAHLKAGSTPEDATERGGQASVLKSYLVSRPEAENTIVGGDFNIYYSTETAYNMLTAEAQANLHDPVGAGSYHGNGAYAMHFTQSTRYTEQFDGGATGGMDDRFDYMLFSDDLLNGSNGVQYIPNSYRAVGQDGNRLNASLVDPVNTSLPANVINALYYMSDHLPVYMQLKVGGDLSLSSVQNLPDYNVYPVPANDMVNVRSSLPFEKVKIIDLLGRTVTFEEGAAVTSMELRLDGISAGSYYLEIHSGSSVVTKKIQID